MSRVHKLVDQAKQPFLPPNGTSYSLNRTGSFHLSNCHIIMFKEFYKQNITPSPGVNITTMNSKEKNERI